MHRIRPNTRTPRPRRSRMVNWITASQRRDAMPEPASCRHLSGANRRRSVTFIRGAAVSGRLRATFFSKELAYVVCLAPSPSRTRAARDPQIRHGAGDITEPGRTADRPAATAGDAAGRATQSNDTEGHTMASGQADSVAIDAGCAP